MHIAPALADTERIAQLERAAGEDRGELAADLAEVRAQAASWFRFLPDTRIAWRDVWIGAGITSLLFVIGQFLIGLYLGRSSVASVYLGMVLFFGAEVTQVFANRWGSRALTSLPATAGERSSLCRSSTLTAGTRTTL